MRKAQDWSLTEGDGLWVIPKKIQTGDREC